MKTFKKLLPILFTVTIITVLFAVTPMYTVASDYSGTCGENVTWEYVPETRNLYLMGTGDMNNYGLFSEAPWSEYSKHIGRVIVGGLNNIGDYAFYGCESLEFLMISDCIETIGERSFYGCKSLERITIPPSVTVIEDEAFSGCSVLREVEFNQQLTTIGKSAFVGTAITQINFPDSLTMISNMAFNNCKSLKEVNFGSKLTTIGGGAFSGCGITTLIIPSSVVNFPTTFGLNGVFEKCNDLKYVVINSTDVPEKAFRDCKSLDNVVFSKNTISINESAFLGCGTKVYQPGDGWSSDKKCITDVYYDGTEKDWINKVQIDSGNEAILKANVKYNSVVPNFIMNFTDVKPNHWFYGAVEYCVDKGYVSGMDEYTFSPNSNITREQFVLILANIAGVDTNEFKNVSSGFTDVPTGQWYSGAVTWAVREGYVSGMSATTFGRGQSIQRAALARMLYNYASANGIDVTGRADLSGFGDAADFDKAGNAWMKEPVQWAVDAGIISGMTVNGKNCVNAKGTATRAQAARMLMQFDELMK